MGGYIETMRILSEHFGDEHDLAVLSGLPDTQPKTIGDERTVQTLKSSVEERQAELSSEAKNIGHRICAEKPRNCRMRIQAYWQVWQSEAAAVT